MLNQALANLPLVKGCPKPDPVLLKQQLGGKAGLYSKWISRVNLPPEGIGLLPQLDTSKRVSLGRHSNQLFEGFLQGRSDQEVMRSDEEGSDENESEISSGDFDFDSSDSEDEGSSSSYSPSEDSDSSLDEAARNVRMEEMNRYFDLGSAKDKKARIAQMFLARKPPRVPQDVLMLDKLEDDPFTPAIPGSAAQPKGISKDRGGRQYMNYYGTWEKGEMHGNGGYVFADGGVYIGDFAHNRLHGQGEMAQSMATYAGMWAENKRNGSGKTQCGHGCVYEGEYVDGVRSGYGVLRLPTGVIYEGNFKHGVFSGRGEIRSPMGYTYFGNWEDGYIQGSGTLVLPCKTRILREWEEPVSFAELIANIRAERRSTAEAKKNQFRYLCRAIVRTQLNMYVKDVRDKIKREKEEAEEKEREELDRLRLERRKQINQAREEAMKAAEGMDESAGH